MDQHEIDKQVAEARTHYFNVSLFDPIHLFRQAGGCLELSQLNSMGREQDIVHICDDQVAAFVAELLAVLPEFVERTNPK